MRNSTSCKLALVMLVTCVNIASAFAPSVKDSTAVPALHATRQEFLVATLSTASATAIMTSVSQPAAAAKYGSFGRDSPEVLVPGNVDIDREILESSAVQSALSKIKSFKSVVGNMQSTLQNDSQANLALVVVKELDISTLRSALNTANTALEEDSQRGTDRLIRVILQDITEVEIASTQKEGIARSPRRLEILDGKLAKLDKAFDDYLAFFA